MRAVAVPLVGERRLPPEQHRRRPHGSEVADEDQRADDYDTAKGSLPRATPDDGDRRQRNQGHERWSGEPPGAQAHRDAAHNG